MDEKQTKRMEAFKERHEQTKFFNKLRSKMESAYNDDSIPEEIKKPAVKPLMWLITDGYEDTKRSIMFLKERISKLEEIKAPEVILDAENHHLVERTAELSVYEKLVKAIRVLNAGSIEKDEHYLASYYDSFIKRGCYDCQRRITDEGENFHCTQNSRCDADPEKSCYEESGAFKKPCEHYVPLAYSWIHYLQATQRHLDQMKERHCTKCGSKEECDSEDWKKCKCLANHLISDNNRRFYADAELRLLVSIFGEKKVFSGEFKKKVEEDGKKE